MKNIHILLMLPIILLPLSCNADESINDSKTVMKLLNHFFPNNIKIEKNAKPNFKLGDFNGDGLEDIAVLFMPASKPIESKTIKVSMPWVYPSTKQSKNYHKSLIIFQNSGGNWFSGETQVFAMLDTTGVLETPSFKLLVSKKSDKDYKEHTNIIPIKTNNDLIVLPTEAGIDTYIYWDKNTYKFFEPEETP